jgi:GT2 family glycosyltransferase
VTVVTATFNALTDLRVTVASVASQEFGDVEHVIVDGGSTDGTREFLESLPAGVQWVSEPDGGIADAMNKGIAMAKGHYIIVIQAGDFFMTPGSLGLAAAGLSGDDLVSHPVILRGGRGDRLLPARPFGIRTEFRMTSPHQGLFVARRLYERVGGFDTRFRIASDYEFLLRARRAGATIKVVPEPLAIMPETGISTRPDWASVKRRLQEDRALQAQHLALPGGRIIHELFWGLYMPWKRLACLMRS